MLQNSALNLPCEPTQALNDGIMVSDWSGRASVSIIIPTLDEIENIDGILSSVVDSMSPNHIFEILVADGGSRDGTIDQILKWQMKAPISLVQGNGTGGLAGDVLAAAREAKFSIIAVLDADGSHPVEALPSLIAPIFANHTDMAIGSRYAAGGAIDGWPLRRHILSRLGATLAWPFTDASDPMSGFFAIRREKLLAVSPRASGFKIALEAIQANGSALRVLDVPIRFTDRVRGTSKIGPGQMIAYLQRLFFFAGASGSMQSISRFATVGLTGFMIDVFVVTMLQALGASFAIAHVWGFCFAATFNYIANARWSFAGHPTGIACLIRYLFVTILALAMRGGVLTLFTTVTALPDVIGIGFGILAGAIVSYIGSEYFVFPSNRSQSAATNWKLATVAVLVYVILLRLVYQASIDLIPQEAYYWNYAQHLDWGYLDHPPMVAWMIKAGTFVFGDSEFGIRAGATLAWFITACFGFRLALNLFGRVEAFLTLLMISTLPFFFSIGMVMTPDAPLTAAWAGALYYLERAFLGKLPKAWIGAGIFVGLGLLSKYTIGLLVPATLILLLLRPGSRRWLLTPWPYLSALVATLVFSPVISWNATHEWASFVFQGSRRWNSSFHFSFHVLIGYAVTLLGPIGLIFIALTFKDLLRQSIISHTSEKAAFILVYTFTPLAVFVVFSLTHSVKLNWTGPLWLMVLPAVAHLISNSLKGPHPSRLIQLWTIGSAGQLVLFAACLHYVALGIPFIGQSKSLRGLPIAWEEFAKGADQAAAKVVQEGKGVPVLVGMDSYNIASQLSFYLRGQDYFETITSQNLVGRSGLMFSEWLSKTSLTGRTVIMFGLTPSSIADRDVVNFFATTGPITKRFVWKHGRIAGEFYYRVGYDLRDMRDHSLF